MLSDPVQDARLLENIKEAWFHEGFLDFTDEDMDDLARSAILTIRESERVAVSALVEAALAFDGFIQMVDSGMSVFPLDPMHEDSEPRVYEHVADALHKAANAHRALKASAPEEAPGAS